MVVGVVNLNTAELCPKAPAKKPALGIYIYILVAMSVIGGFLFGYDTGIVSAAMLYVPRDPGLRPMGNFWQEIIVSITPGLAGISALFAGKASDVYGRRRVIMISCILFITGACICSIGINKLILLFGRLLLGIAIVPIYVGEASPAYIRGRLLTGFEFMINFGMMSANIIAGGFSYISPTTIGWRLMLGFAAIPALIQMIGFLYLPESPRWLYSKQKSRECERVLEKIYNKDVKWISYEMSEIKMAHEQELQDKMRYGDGMILKRILTTPPVRRALFVGCCLQAFQQLTGINTIMYYTGAIIKSAGVRDNHTTIWISVATSSIKLLCTFIPMYFIERAGRRVLLIVSVIGVIMSLLLMGGAFVLINQDSALTLQSIDSNTVDPSVPDFKNCLSHSNCDFCVTDESCGFCGLTNMENKTGYCFPKNESFGDVRSATGQCASVNSTNELHRDGTEIYEWADTFCQTRYTVLPILIMLLYLCCFATGYGPLPWLMNAEFYPLWARGTCVSITTFCNWTFNLIISLTFLTLSQFATKFGVFFIYATITVGALIFFIKFVPETRGCSLDEVELLFMTKEERMRSNNNATGNNNRMLPKPGPEVKNGDSTQS